MAFPNLKVIDVSHHNTVMSFDGARKAGVLGVIHKASQGLGYADPAYAERRVKAKTAGLLWGAYHFNTGDSVAAQVEHFLKAAAPDDKTLMCLDWEANKGHDMSKQKAYDFLGILGEKLGRKPVLYSGNVAKEQIGSRVDPFFASHRLWLCQYGPRARLQASWPHYWLWQYTDGTAPHPLPNPHSVAGISGLLDCNHFDGTDAQLIEQWA
jgi:lysozyme